MTTPANDPDFSMRKWAGGCTLVSVFGGVATMAAIAAGSMASLGVLTVLLAMLPGGVFVLWALRAEDRSFRQGMLVGAITIAILGGLCGIGGAG